ncbi:MAG TPA: M28 family peptidase [Solirubrobacteraceae bacterium]|nr:M28 family peptidase [Solirubrobacteraceae bacterium]
MAADAQRMIAELRELAQLAGTERGAQRVARTDTWAKAREWERRLLNELPVAVQIDEAGNQWATLRGAAPQAVIIGSHIDSVSDGGWLDGCFGVLASLEVLRVIAADGVGTVGRIDAEPGIPTAVAGVATALVDQRHVDAETLRELHEEIEAVSRSIAGEERVVVSWSPLARIAPITFDPELIEVAAAVVVRDPGLSRPRGELSPGGRSADRARG